jgi:putative ABC transport system permease protein
VWVPYTVTGSGERGILVRTAQDPAALLDAVRKEIWATDRNVAVTLTGTLEGFIARFAHAGPRFGFVMMGLFAAIGLVLVTIGVYSVIAYTTARQTQEIGIRMALGAEQEHVLRMVLRNGTVLALSGIAIGLAAAFLLARLIAALLFETSAADPPTFSVVPLLLLAVAVLASYLPARRAARIDPMAALRCE